MVKQVLLAESLMDGKRDINDFIDYGICDWGTVQQKKTILRDDFFEEPWIKAEEIQVTSILEETDRIVLDESREYKWNNLGIAAV